MIRVAFLLYRHGSRERGLDFPLMRIAGKRGVKTYEQKRKVFSRYSQRLDREGGRQSCQGLGL